MYHKIHDKVSSQSSLLSLSFACVSPLVSHDAGQGSHQPVNVAHDDAFYEGAVDMRSVSLRTIPDGEGDRIKVKSVDSTECDGSGNANM